MTGFGKGFGYLSGFFRTISLFVLIALLFLQSGGLIMIYHVEMSYVRFTIHQTLKNERTNFESMVLPFSVYLDHKIDEEEFSIYGKMYDVKSVVIKNDTAYMKVINDTKEEKIIEQLQKTIQGQTPQKMALPGQIIKLQSQSYLKPGSFSISFINEYSKRQFCQGPGSYVSVIIDVNSPPPKNSAC